MSGTPPNVIDSHVHLFLATPLARPDSWPGGLSPEQTALMKSRFDSNLRERGQPQADTSLSTPEEYARRWTEEFDRYGIRAGVFLSLIDDPEPLRAFVAASPERFIGYAFVDPLDPGAPAGLEDQITRCGFRGLKLIPTNQRFRASDRRVYPLWEKVSELQIPVLIHYGVSIGYNADFRYADPLDLQPVLRDFPDLNFILAHFGAGFFREALMLCYQADNVYLDSSSSNIWIRYQGYPLTLRDVFRRALDAAGPGRVIFGTDSSFFPRGFRSDILEEQQRIMDDLELSDEHRRLVLGGNISQLLGLGGAGSTLPGLAG